MEQLMEANRQARGKLNTLGKRRAMELQMEHPQMMEDNQLETTEELRGKGGGEAGLKRVIGGGKRGRPKKVVGEALAGAGMCLNDQLEGEGSNGCMTGGAKLGKDLAQQIRQLHGEGFYKDFVKGFTGKEEKKMRGAGDNISAKPSGLQVSHAKMSPAETGLAGQALGGQDVPPGGVAPVAYGNVPQAPASFKRNTVGGAKELMGRPGHGTKKPVMEAMNTARMTGAGKGSTRGQMISKLMKTKGMTLPQASKYLKEHPEGV